MEVENEGDEEKAGKMERREDEWRSVRDKVCKKYVTHTALVEQMYMVKAQ